MSDSSQTVTQEPTSSSVIVPELGEFVSATGHRYYARPGTEDSGIFEHVVDDNEYNLPRQFDHDDIIIDIGAHIGGFSYASLVRGAGKVYAYEAHPGNHAIASKNVERFGERVSCRQQAVWRSDQPSQTLYNQDLTGHGNTGGISLLWNNEGLSVATVSLDEILTEASDGFRNPIRLLKIDCEGSEYPILFTSKHLNIVGEICGEYHEMPPEQIPDRAKISGKFEKFDRFALKQFFEDQGWSVVLEPKAERLGLFHARPIRRTSQLKDEPPEIDLAKLMAQIRQAVELRESQGKASFINVSTDLFKLIFEEGLVFPDFPDSSIGEVSVEPGQIKRLRLQPEFQPRADASYHVNDLLKYHDQEFIWNAYRAILKREPDQTGLRNFLELLRSGNRNKIDILASLRSSAEGKRANVTVEGLRWPALIRQCYRLPVIGYVAELIVALARLPVLIRSQRQLENHLVAQQERLADYVAQGDQRLLNQLNQLSEETNQQAAALHDELDARAVSLHNALVKLAQQQQELAVLQHQQVSALFRTQQRMISNPGIAGSHEARLNRNRQAGNIDLDGIEASLSDHLRGDPNVVKKDLGFYLSLLKESGVTGEILDLGCGSGLWLELLDEAGLPANGVETNGKLVEAGRTRGLKITQRDVIEHLRHLQTNSLQAVTAFHLIEHLGFYELLELLKETQRVLKPGGLVVMETPNPKNLVVGACNFYADPTHRQPLFPETVQFLLDNLGFARTRIDYLHPVEGSPFTGSEPGFRELHIWLFGPRDFAAIGWKS